MTLRIFRNPHRFPPAVTGCAIALGNFDGLHRGHREVIATTRTVATQESVSTAVMTFHPHPRVFFSPKHAPIELASFRTKVRQFSDAGVDVLYAMTFNRAFSERPAESFVRDVLAGALRARHVVVGHDFVFGHGREGNADMLYAMAAECGYAFTQVTAVRDGSATCSSTQIRQYLKDGNLAAANAMLGHAYEIEGRVLRGDQHGRTLGFPTANLSMDTLFRPAFGAYAVRVQGLGIRDQEEWLPAVANLGVRPTVDGERLWLEVHIFDFDGDLYGQLLRVQFVEYLRPEKTFDGVEVLKAQIEQDCEQARVVLEGEV